jgi:hypothetical protein
MDACEIELKNVLDECIEAKEYDICNEILKKCSSTFSLYNHYRKTINDGKLLEIEEKVSSKGPTK